MAAYNLAVELDPELGRAYAGLAAMDAEYRKRQEAEKNYQAALSRIDRMTDREKYRDTQRLLPSDEKSTEGHRRTDGIGEAYPSDTAGHANLALAYFYQRDMTKALEEQKRAIEIHAAKRAAAEQSFAVRPLRGRL